MADGQDSARPPGGPSGGETTPPPPQNNLTPPAQTGESIEKSIYRKILKFTIDHPIWSSIITYFVADFVLKKISESFSWSQLSLVRPLIARMPHFQVQPEINWITGPIGAFLIYRIYSNISPARRAIFGAIRPWLVVIGTLCFFAPFIQLPRLATAPPRFRLAFLTSLDNRRMQIVYVTNDCLEQRGTNGPFSQTKGVVLAVPMGTNKDYGDLHFFLTNDSPVPAFIVGLKFQWSSEPDLVLTNGWTGMIADYDRGFSNCLSCNVSAFVGRAAVPIPPIQFERTSNGFENVKGAMELTVMGTNFVSTLTFGIQFISDSNRTAYATEQPIWRNGLSVDFPYPHRP